MKKAFFLLFVSLFLVLPIEAQPEIIRSIDENGNRVKWVYIDGDEFDGTEINKSKWYTCPGGWNREHGEELQYYLDSNIVVENGVLKLVAKYQPGNYYVWRKDENGHLYQTLKAFDYTSGWIESKQKYKYGLFQIRFKIPSGDGLWPAFWLFGGHPNEEIDVFEFLGDEPNVVHCTVHYPPSELDHDPYTNVNHSVNYNIMEGEWGNGNHKKKIRWLHNGEVLKSWHAVSLDYQESVRANLAVACEGCFNSGGPSSSTIFPAIFEIDFIRIYCKYECEQNIEINDYQQSMTDPSVITGKKVKFGSTNNGSLLEEGQYLTVVCSEDLYIESEFFAEPGSNLHVIIADCEASIEKGNEFGKDKSDVKPHNTQIVTEDIRGEIRFEKDACHPFDEANWQTNSIAEKQLKPYPMPASNELTIEFAGFVDHCVSIQLFDQFGLNVYSKTVINTNNLKIDVSSFPRGFYVLKYVYDDKVVSEKIILE